MVVASDSTSELRSFASVTHELRAPLHAIIGLAELLGDAELGPRERDLALSIQRQGEAMQVVIDDVLELSRISAGELELVIDVVGPRVLVDEVFTTFEPAARAKGLELNVRIGDGVPRAVRTDKHRLRQVLVNLVSNAVKYTDFGSVTIEVAPSPSEAEVLQLFVHDTGPGIASAALPGLFDAFTQARSSDQIKGTGLGLSITKQLVELMGGWIYVCSSDTGTTFCATVPFAPARRSTDQDPMPAPAAASGGRRVLVVDDTEVNLLVAASQLERLGHDAHTVSSGAVALVELVTNDFDLVLLDWHMPGTDGLEVIRRYREHCLESGRRGTPIVMMTASVSSASRQTCLEAGAVDFLAKPVSIRDLAQCLGRWLGDPLDAALETDDPTEDAVSDAIDPAVIEKLVQDLGGAEPVCMVIETFMADVDDRRSQLSSDDVDVARRAAHTLKSTSRLLGARQLADVFAAAESGLAATPTSRPNLDEIDFLLDEALAALRRTSGDLASSAPLPVNSKERP